MRKGGATIPDPNAKRDQKLEAILGAVNKTNTLLTAQNKILERMERNTQPKPIGKHPYLKENDGGDGLGSD